MPKGRLKKTLKYIALITTVLLVTGLAAILLCPAELTVEFYSIDADNSTAIRIVHLTNLPNPLLLLSI